MAGNEHPDQERHGRHGNRSIRRGRIRRGRKDHDHRDGVGDAGRPGHRRQRQVRAPRRHRRAHAHGHAVRRHHLGRRLRIRHHRRRLRRHHHHRRLRDPIQRPDAPSRLRHVDEEGRGQGRHRLRLPHDHHRAVGPGGDRDGRAGQAGRDLVQAVHGLSRRVHAGRCEHLPRHAAHGKERRHHLHARRERRRDRRAGQGSARPGPHRAEVSRA